MPSFYSTKVVFTLPRDCIKKAPPILREPFFASPTGLSPEPAWRSREERSRRGANHLQVLTQEHPPTVVQEDRSRAAGVFEPLSKSYGPLVDLGCGILPPQALNYQYQTTHSSNGSAPDSNLPLLNNPEVPVEWFP